MSAEFFLVANSRVPKKHAAGRLRKNRKLPAVVYGHGFPTRHLELEAGPFAKMIANAGGSTLVSLTVDAEPPVKVLISEVQHDTRTGLPMHADFHQVSMTERVTAEVSLAFIGESPAVKEQSGVLLKNLDHVRVEGLPGDLVPEISVQLASLVNFESRILVRDLPVPTGLTLMDPAEEVVAMVEPPRSEEEIAALSEKVEEKVEEVGVVEKAKKEGEEEAEVGEVPEAKTDKAKTEKAKPPTS